MPVFTQIRFVPDYMCKLEFTIEAQRIDLNKQKNKKKKEKKNKKKKSGSQQPYM